MREYSIFPQTLIVTETLLLLEAHRVSLRVDKVPKETTGIIL